MYGIAGGGPLVRDEGQFLSKTERLNAKKTTSSEVQHLETFPKPTNMSLNSGPSSSWFPWAGLQCQAGKARLSSSYGIELP